MTDPHEILQHYWGYSSFRPLQEDIVNSVIEGRDTLALLPTGGGKSICFQVPGMASGGLTLVISPLIALMQDQVRNLNAAHIPATYINSTLKFRDIDRKLQMAMDGKFRFLYMAPERLHTELFTARLDRLNIRLIAVDEAHCVSQWGYDFRPSYMRVAELRERLPGIPMIALTASAPPQVCEDIKEKLGMEDPQTFRKSFRRDNLRYAVIASEDPVSRIRRYLQSNPNQAGIIYTRTRKRTVVLAKYLREQGFSAGAYHGGLPARERSTILDQWMRNEIKVIAATNAFGMGIDKPDVRFVIHYNLPSDIESYYQEAGRGGRDGKTAHAIGFQNEADLEELDRWVAGKYPRWEQLQRHYEYLCNHFGIPNTAAPERVFPLDVGAIAKTFKTNPLHLYNSVRLLHREGQLVLNDRPDDYGHVRVTVRPHDVIKYKDQYPQQAWLLDLILRQLGGEAYSELMRFLPGHWARVAEREEEELLQALDILAQRRIIAYRAPSGHPSVFFLRPRHTLTKRELNWEKYAFLKQRAQERLESMKSYSEAPAKACRARMLEKYFGEEDGEDCGICDYCTVKAQQKEPGDVQAEMRAEIKALIGEGEMGYWEIVEGMTKGSEEQRRELIRVLLDQKILERIGALSFRWKG